MNFEHRRDTAEVGILIVGEIGPVTDAQIEVAIGTVLNRTDALELCEIHVGQDIVTIGRDVKL